MMTRSALNQLPLEETPPRLRMVVDHGGGPPPGSWSGPLIDSRQLGLIVFMVFETMIFAGLTSAYLVLRSSSLVWPPPDLPHLPIVATWLNTAVLLISAVTMRSATSAIATGQRRTFQRDLIITAVLGSVFLVVQGSEWARLIAQGLTLSAHVYGATFYSLIGLHALHVVGAVVWLLAVLGLALAGRFDEQRHAAVRLCGMYWYYVSGLWLVLFGIVYLY